MSLYREIPLKTPLIPPNLEDNGDEGVVVRNKENFKEKTVCEGKECFSCGIICKKCSLCQKDFYSQNLPEEWRD